MVIAGSSRNGRIYIARGPRRSENLAPLCEPAVKITYYLEVISSWCHWAEPTWAELKRRYADRVEFGWKIAQMPLAAYPVSKNQLEWFYRRSGSVVRSPYMLNSDWFEPEIMMQIAANHTAEAARELGVTDDRVRLAIQRAAVLEGKKIGRWEVAAEVAAKAGKLNKSNLLARAKSKEIAARVKKPATSLTRSKSRNDRRSLSKTASATAPCFPAPCELNHWPRPSTRNSPTRRPTIRGRRISEIRPRVDPRVAPSYQLDGNALDANYNLSRCGDIRRAVVRLRRAIPDAIHAAAWGVIRFRW